MKKIIPLLFVLMSCHHYTAAEKEEQRRADAELNSVMQMVVSRDIPPIEFEFNSAKLKPSSYQLLNKVAEILLRYSKLKLIVEGHTDDIGSDEYNDKLSFLRADAVKGYLVKKGVFPDFIRIYGYGKRRPVLKEKTQQARDLNRRVEFKITTRKWGTVF